MLHTAPICLSIVAIRLLAPGFKSLLLMTFSTARTTPSLHRIPTDVPPFSTALTAYSTWKFLPSGEKTEFVRSYPVPIDVWGATGQLECISITLQGLLIRFWKCSGDYHGAFLGIEELWRLWLECGDELWRLWKL